MAGTLSLVTCALEAHAPTIAALRSTDPVALLDTRPGALACSRLLLFAARVPTSGAGAVIGVVQPPLMMPLDREDLDDDTSTRASAPPPPTQSLPGLDAGHPELTAWGDAGDEETPPPTPVAVDPGVPLAPGLREVCPGVALAYAPAHSVPYAALGAEMAAQGVVLDLFALGPHFLGLYALAPAAEVTGGAVYRYPDPLSSRLAQVEKEEGGGDEEGSAGGGAPKKLSRPPHLMTLSGPHCGESRTLRHAHSTTSATGRVQAYRLALGVRLPAEAALLSGAVRRGVPERSPDSRR